MARLTREERKLIEAPPVKWRELVDRLLEDIPHANVVNDVLSGEAERLTRLAAYVEFRYNRPTAGHDRAVKAASKAVTAVRKALGYAYPKDDLDF